MTSTTSKRTRLRAIYLTDTERDLVSGALLHLRESLSGGNSETINRDSKFAKSHTAKRLWETAQLFTDKGAQP